MRVSGIIADIIQIINRSHGDLQDLGVDDHTQYYNLARGDARYYTETELDVKLALKVEIGGNLGGTITVPTVTGLTIPSEAQVDILVRGASAWIRFPKGTGGQMLKMNSGATALVWSSTIAAGSVAKEQFVNYELEAGFVVTNEGGVGYATLGNGSFTKRGQRKDYTASPGNLKKLGFWLQISAGSPTGDVIFGVRKVSDDSLIGEVVAIQAENLSGSPAFVEATFTPVVILNEDVRMYVQFLTGNASNYLGVQATGSDSYADEVYTSYDGSWTDTAGNDIDTKRTKGDRIYLIE